MQLEQGKCFHVYNRANSDNDKLFVTANNYLYFLKKYHEYMVLHWDTLSYCLLPNHFHLFVRIHENCDMKKARQSFKNFLNCYAKSFNKAHGRRGSLFQKNAKALHVADVSYYQSLVRYIHRNPLKHKIVTDLDNWMFSSYFNFLGLKNDPCIENTSILSVFDSVRHFKNFVHADDPQEMVLKELLFEE